MSFKCNDPDYTLAEQQRDRELEQRRKEYHEKVYTRAYVEYANYVLSYERVFGRPHRAGLPINVLDS